MNEVELTWGRTIKVWWSLMWRGWLFAFIAAFIVGIIVAIVRAIIGFDQGTGVLVSTLGGFLIGLLIGMWVVKIILNKKYSDFRIALVSID